VIDGDAMTVAAKHAFHPGTSYSGWRRIGSIGIGLVEAALARRTSRSRPEKAPSRPYSIPSLKCQMLLHGTSTGRGRFKWIKTPL